MAEAPNEFEARSVGVRIGRNATGEPYWCIWIGADNTELAVDRALALDRGLQEALQPLWAAALSPTPAAGGSRR